MKVERREKYPIDDIGYVYCNNQLIEMLYAYDTNESQSADELLKCCEILADALYKLDTSNEIAFLNVAQVKKRAGKLAPTEVSRLEKLVVNSANEGTKVIAAALLDLPTMCQELKKQCSKSTLTEIQNSPFRTFVF